MQIELHKSVFEFNGRIVDAEPIGRTERWVVLTEDGAINIFEGDKLDEVLRTTVFFEPTRQFFGTPKLRLAVSADGRFVAVSTDFGRYGEVFDLLTGKRTMKLDAGDYFFDTVKASIAFADSGNQAILIHRTDWNRLDISDPETGELLTVRESPDHDDPSDRYLDYFHGALLLNPESNLLLDDGWVWHPLGAPTVFKIDDWLNKNVWESECGPSKVGLCVRSYWNHGYTWIDTRVIAVEGIGDDDDKMIDGVRLFDVELFERAADEDYRWASEIKQIVGPCGELFSDGIFLYSADSNDLVVWDLESGAELARFSGYSPERFNRSTGQFADFRDGNLTLGRVISDQTPPNI